MPKSGDELRDEADKEESAASDKAEKLRDAAAKQDEADAAAREAEGGD